MGQKVNPHGLRVGVIAGWDAQWYANKKDFSKFILEDHKIREYIKKKYYTYGISKVHIERAQDKIVINIHTSKPGMKQAMSRVMRSGAKGVKIMVAGRLDGAEIARSESYHEGSIPLQTMRADIDYGTAEAHTTFGIIGVKVWVYKGEVLPVVKSEGGEQ